MSSPFGMGFFGQKNIPAYEKYYPLLGKNLHNKRVLKQPGKKPNI
jgi:hypothetical protein